MALQLEPLLKTGSDLLLISMTSSVLLARFVPELHVFLLYGKTKLENNEKAPKLPLIVQWITTLYVPKRFFLHFYILSLALSVLLLSYCAVFCESSKLNSDGILFTTFIAIQGFRRSLECFFLEKSHPKAVIHFSHYIVGVLFYTLVNNVAFLAIFTSHTSTSHLMVASAILTFTLGSILQSSFHYHLSTLVKYSLPTFSLFRIVACPHYFAEIIIYSSLLLICPPQLYQTVILLILWIVVNLSVSADQTRNFYKQKFGSSPPYSIIPYLY